MRKFLARHLSPSLAVSAMAVVLALGSGAAVAASGLVGTKQIRNGAVTTAKLHDRAVTSGKLAPLGAYHNVGTAAVPFQNGWHNANGGFAPTRFYTDPYGVVHLEGTIIGGGSSFAFSLPPGFRPAFEHAWAISSGAGTTMAQVLHNGAVMVFNLSGFDSLDGISFRTR
jgi:hypothetical protein